MIVFLFKIFITGLLLVAWWYLKRYLKKNFAGSFKSILWTYRLRFDDEVLGRGGLKIKKGKKKVITIFFESKNLNKGGYGSISVLIGGESVLKIDSHEVLNGKRKVKEALMIEPINGDEIEVITDGVKVTSSIFNVDKNN